MAEDAKPSGPDLTRGIALSEIADSGMLAGHVGEDEVVLVRQGQDVFALAAHCTHYHGPLADGIVTGHILRCPWHHARFDIRTGEAVAAPAFDSLGCWAVEQRDGKVFVKAKREQPRPARRAAGTPPQKIVIVGGGAAGFAAAEMLRREQ